MDEFGGASLNCHQPPNIQQPQLAQNAGIDDDVSPIISLISEKVCR